MTILDIWKLSCDNIAEQLKNKTKTRDDTFNSFYQ
uniref:Uncharacterized protein n=1 Tax=Manihot esculenta TaxID=3983 RepID=A0A2C9VG65_MANES